MSGDFFVVGNMVWNGCLVAAAAWMVKRWIHGTDKKFDDTKEDITSLRQEAEARGLRLHARLDELTGCITGIKIKVESKVDRDDCTQIGRDRQQALMDHEHACCAGRDARVIP